MFTVEKPEYISKTFRMPLDLVQKLEVLAQENHVSLNSLVTQCCVYALKNTHSNIVKSQNEKGN